MEGVLDELVERKFVLEFIEKAFESAFEAEHRTVFIDLIEKKINNLVFDDNQTLKDHMTWIRQNKFLKINSYKIPQTEMVLHDIKVQSKGPDDEVYDKYEDIRARVARGNTILERNLNGKKEYDLVIYALRKFSGGMGDEDEVERNNSDWKKYFLVDIDKTEYVVSLQKANGEAAHMSCRFIDGEFLICAGSKNVHLVFKKIDDLFEYREEKFTYAKVIAQAVLNNLSQMNELTRKVFLSFLCWTRFTAVFELLNPNTQHVEDLSYLNEPLLKFITFTDNKLNEKPTSLCCLPPELSIKLGELFELSCVGCKKLAYKDAEDYLTKIRKDFGYEGVVLYFIDSEFNVIGLLKKKTVWYIIIRAVREKIRRHINPKNQESLDQLKERISKRLKAVRSWIGFSENDLIKWTDLVNEFAVWFDQSFKSGTIRQVDYVERFPVLWNKFLKETQQSDHIELNI